MPSATGQHTVLVFKKIQFLGSWTRSNGANQVIYTAASKPTMRVVFESYAGTMTTYFFTLQPRDEVGSLDWHSQDAIDGFEDSRFSVEYPSEYVFDRPPVRPAQSTSGRCMLAGQTRKVRVASGIAI